MSFSSKGPSPTSGDLSLMSQKISRGPDSHPRPKKLSSTPESTKIRSLQVMQAAANIRALRPPSAYKGKGIRYTDEIVKLKTGKKK